MTRILWTPAEDALLRELHPSGLSYDEIAARIAPRSRNAVEQRCVKLRLGPLPHGRLRWKPSEDALLREIWEQKGSLKMLSAKYLPRRSAAAMSDRGRELGLAPRPQTLRNSTYSWVTEEVRRALLETPDLTVSQLAERCAGSHRRITMVLAEGHGKGFWRSGWAPARGKSTGRRAPRWSVGFEDDVPPPSPIGNTLRMRLVRARARQPAPVFDPFATLVQQVAA
ncbi:SANT/Myb-like DNA-binding domain-containing protein [Paraburkholderia sp. SIMBA_027]|uniref:SANT/Myb-like DNA-binding domain-containing protein n=1 Tax=Paraburkholderia sp. SIMBA_027 TaxID=3085770 RepID=UPI00397E5669